MAQHVREVEGWTGIAAVLTRELRRSVSISTAKVYASHRKLPVGWRGNGVRFIRFDDTAIRRAADAEAAGRHEEAAKIRAASIDAWVTAFRDAPAPSRSQRRQPAGDRRRRPRVAQGQLSLDSRVP